MVVAFSYLLLSFHICLVLTCVFIIIINFFVSFFLYVFLAAIALLLVLAGHYALTSVKVSKANLELLNLMTLPVLKFCMPLNHPS